MTLFSLENIKQGLDKEFLPLEPMLTGLRLLDGGSQPSAIDGVEARLNISLPIDFRKLIAAYDFGKLTIGPVAFCSMGDYAAQLIRLNIEVQWWGAGSRPVGLLMVANSDPFAFLLDLNKGAVLAMDSERGWQAAEKVARSFDLFVRGVGTVMLRRNQGVDHTALGREIGSDVGADAQSFWVQLAR